MTLKSSFKTFSLATLTSVGFILAGCVNDSSAKKETSDTVRTAPDAVPHAQLPGTVIPQSYKVDMRMDPDATGFSGRVTIEVENKEETQKIWMHGKHMTVSNASATTPNGETFALSFMELSAEEAPSGIAYLSAKTKLPKGALTLVLDYETPYNQALNSAYQVKRDGEGYIVTQFEPLGAREAFPSFDEPKYKVPFTLSITAPKSDYVYANTPEVKATEMDDGWVKHEFATTRPLPTYLIAFGAGPWDVVDYGILPQNDIRKKDLRLRGIAAKGEGENLEYALKNTDGILSALESYFGQAYPYEKLDIIAAPDYAFGAMENPGAIVYRESLLLLGDDPTLRQIRSYAGVHSHELAHQWFGNLVTPVWWEDIWLNEAFATWSGNKGTEIWQPEGNYDRNTLRSALGAMNIDTLSTTRKVREPLKRSENVMDQFDGITYRKGGGVLSMFESYVGEDKFQEGVQLHMKRYEDSVATGDDFFQSIADGSGNPDVVDAMKSFVDQPGLPLVKASMHCDDDKVTLSLSQSRYAPLGSKTQQGQTWQIPVCAKFGYADGSTSKSCSLMKENQTTEIFEVSQCPTYITPNENGAGYYRFTLDSAGWADLIGNMNALNTREVLTVQDSLVAAFRAGEVEASVFLDGMTAFAHHPEYDVASGSTALIEFMYDDLPNSHDDLARYVQGNYAERFAAINGQDSVEGQLLAPTLATLLVNRGQDETLRQDMIAKGTQYLGLKGTIDKKAVPGNMLRLALSQTMESLGEPAYEPLLSLATKGSPFEKSAALAALASTKDEAIADKLRGLVLDKNGPLTGRQANTLLNGLLASEYHGDASWNWLKANFTQFVTDRVPDVRKGRMPLIAGGFCSAERRDEVKSFMEANSATIPGYERSLLQVVERVELCTALRDEKGADIIEALKAR